MSGEIVGLVAVALMLITIYVGMHIAVALILISFGSIWLMLDPTLAVRMVASAANDSIQDSLYGVVPLFVLMGLLVSVCGVGKDTFDVAGWLLRKIRGGLGMATVGSNAAFAAITGVSIASAAVFSKIAVPEMMRHGHTSRFSVGVVAASSVLGMLIPPSLLLIIYGVLSEQSIGQLFIAGILPGLLLAGFFCLLIVVMAKYFPGFVGQAGGADKALVEDESLGSLIRKGLPIVALIMLVLGGIYTGFFTPMEAGAVGAFGAFVMTFLRRQLTAKKLWRVLVETGHVSVSVLFLIVAASLYSRMLAMTGLPASLTDFMMGYGFGPLEFILIYIAIILVMGCVLDSVSILLIMVPIALPIAYSFGMDPIWFGIITVVAVEIGLITPPFGLSVYTVKASLDDQSISIKEVFLGVIPFVICMFLVLMVLVAFPWFSVALIR
ncbi:TRAP transporter large permease [Halomonas campisalis]|uniref:TRAP transporter large permease protein n=1 Tax=Billgrantia campisalis TaxID=74661 RepID=A0ABS9PB11_9GAMM|nr:TRAP transporter large permease [Halomonas campisalis]MCG6658938.1 TRAP transporter large permease [Halomonas campisalis]MDR5863659.1 TRAP transporter large permease [Halomonas campisalis]